MLLAMLPLVSMAKPITGTYEIPKVPEWAKNAVFYQIYPQTFCDSDGDGIGDLKGIISKLDYVKSLGVDAIWFNPFFDSPFMDAGYDIRDYYKIAPRYGTNEDAKRLFEEAHKRGMHVIFDYVISYTAIDNPWFVKSQKQEKTSIPTITSGRRPTGWTLHGNLPGRSSKVTDSATDSSCAISTGVSLRSISGSPTLTRNSLGSCPPTILMSWRCARTSRMS